ncbi:MAG: right-handed parallel beta-helix repeat-containing protein, partial [Hyphomicrobiales bacterium]|nr:right-handed parallel beta-helix repeat-containing protein [Hyphomicrobiales bacterium]
DNTFHQVSFGFEALSDRWDVRANGYVALSDPEASPDTARVFLSGNNIFLTGGEEVPLSGFDGEVGYKVFSRQGGGRGGLKDGLAPHGPSHELRVYAGGFYFDDGEALEEVAGPRARIEWRIDDVVRRLPGSRLTFEGEFQYDEVREDQWEGGVRFRVPFGGGGKDVRQTILASLTPQERRMTESIVRDTDIVTAESDAEGVSDDLTGTRFESVTVVDNAGDLQQRIDDAGGDSLIVVKGDTHQGPILLGPDQTLQGGGSTIRVRGVESGVVADFTAPGSRPFIELAQDQAILTVDRNTHVAGVGIRGGLGTGENNNGIASLVDGISNIAITDTTITDVGGDGILFGNDHNKILISRTTISDTEGEGIQFDNNNSNIRIAHTSTTNTGREGIDLDENNNDVTIENVVVVNTPADEDGIDFNSNNTNIIIRNATINNVGADAIEFNNNNRNILVQNVTVDTTRNEGIEFDNNNSNIRIVDNVLTNIGEVVGAANENGIQLNYGNTNIVISGNTINGAAGSAFDFDGNNTITLDNNIVTGVIAEDLLAVNGGGNTINGASNVNNAVIGGA